MPRNVSKSYWLKANRADTNQTAPRSSASALFAPNISDPKLFFFTKEGRVLTSRFVLRALQ